MESIINLAILSHPCIRNRCNSDSSRSVNDLCLKYLQSAPCVNRRDNFRHASNANMTHALSSPPASHARVNTLSVITRECGLVNILACPSATSIHLTERDLDFHANKLFNQVANSNGHKTHSDGRNQRLWLECMMREEVLPYFRGSSMNMEH